MLGEVRERGLPAYRFSHALIQQTLVEELSLLRRQRLHLRAAEAIEAVHARALDRHLSGLARHYRDAGAAAEPATVVAVSRRAAEAARAVYAWAEAAAHYQTALDVLEEAHPALRGDLLVAMAEVLNEMGQPGRVLSEVAPEAWDLAEAQGDHAGSARACRVAVEALLRQGLGSALERPEAALWAERADRVAPASGVERVYADGLLGAVRFARGRAGTGSSQAWSQESSEGIRLLLRGLEAARHEDASVFWYAATYADFALRSPWHAPERRRLLQDFAALPVEGLDAFNQSVALYAADDATLTFDERPPQPERWDALLRRAERVMSPQAVALSLTFLAALATVDGRLTEAVDLGARITALGAEGVPPEALAIAVSFATVRALLHLGRFEAALAVAQRPERRALALAALGRTDEARALLDETLARRPALRTAADERSVWEDMFLLEAAVLIGHRELAAAMADRYRGCEYVTTGAYQPTSIRRQQGGAAALLGRREEARAHLEAALGQMEAMGFRPEVALCHLDLAALLAGGDGAARAAARGQLATALPEFAAMGMAPALGRATRLHEALGGAGVPL